MPAELWGAAELLASNAAGIVFASGNRTDPGFLFRRGTQSGSGWQVCVHTPAYTGESRRYGGLSRPAVGYGPLASFICSLATSGVHRPNE